MRWPEKWLLAGGILAAPATASGSETASYIYDALGRLERATTSGTVNHGLDVSSRYDPAGNRSSYTVTGAGATGGLAGGEAAAFGEDAIEGAPAGNRPPVAIDDEGLIGRCAAGAFTVLGNDYDPDGDGPLTLVSVTAGGGGAATISGDHILFTPAAAGTAAVAYVIADAQGAAASATLTVEVTDEPCQP